MADKQQQQAGAYRFNFARRPVRLRVSLRAGLGFGDAPATRGRCQFAGCQLFEWCTGARYCRDHWLQVYQKDRLPERPFYRK